MIRFDFNERRATHAAAFLILRAKGRLDYLKMVKMLYFSDRISLIKWGYPISGGSYFSLPKGPVVSEVMDAANGKGFAYWQTLIEKHGTIMALTHTVDLDELSKSDKEILAYIFDKLNLLSPREIVENVCHNGLKTPEWTPLTNGRKPLFIEDILTKVGKKTTEQIETVANQANLTNKLNAMALGLESATR